MPAYCLCLEVRWQEISDRQNGGYTLWCQILLLNQEVSLQYVSVEWKFLNNIEKCLLGQSLHLWAQLLLLNKPFSAPLSSVEGHGK